MDTGWLFYFVVFCGIIAATLFAIFGWQAWQKRRKRLLRASACNWQARHYYGSGIYLPDPKLVTAWTQSLLPPPEVVEAQALALPPHFPTREEIEAEIRRRQQM